VFKHQQIKMISLPLILGLVLTGCSQDLSPKSGEEVPLGRTESRKKDYGKLFGEEFLLFGGPKKRSAAGTASSLVNPFIWRASLDTLSFMPLASADAVGGVIITDWYTAPSTPHERLKVTIYVTTPQLRADALKVTIYKQVKKGEWVNAPADPASAVEMENIILSKARQLRVHHLESTK
jgi:hypothetical protein